VPPRGAYSEGSRHPPAVPQATSSDVAHGGRRVSVTSGLLSARTRSVTDYAELSRRIQAEGLLRRRYAYYWCRIVGLVSVFAAIWVAFAFVGNSWFQLVLAGLLAAVVTQFGFLGHDGAHRQIFASHGWNEWVARILSGAFAGLSYSWWSSKHNRHHGSPNQEGKDPDIAPGALAFTPSIAAERTGFGAVFAQYQGYLFFPLLLLEGLNLHVASVISLTKRDPLKKGHGRKVELALVLLRLGGYVAVLMLFLPFGKAVAFFGVQMGLFGLFLGGSFAPNHKGMPIVPKTAKIDFMRRQVLMSRNINPGPLTDFAMGGLNYQIEHHLFPSMPRPNLRRAQPIVRSFCHEQGITYTQVPLLTSYGIVIRYLNAVGLRARDPFTCPLVSMYRG
jgi:fatty acid desaturase